MQQASAKRAAKSRSTASAPYDPVFTVDRREISAGSTASLNWQWKPATRGYLSSVGLLDRPSGDTVSVLPNETTSYVLVLEAPNFPPRILTETVVVRGAKGRAGDWPEDPFVPLPYQTDYDMPPASLPELANKVHQVLQNDRGFEIREFSPEKNQIVFSTGFLENAELSDPNEKPRRRRRIAYRVALMAKESHLIHLNLSASIEWRIAVDNRWFPENSSTSLLYSDQIRDLWTALKEKHK